MARVRDDCRSLAEKHFADAAFNQTGHAWLAELLWGNRELRETLDNATESVANLHDRVRSLIRSANRQASAWTP